MSELQKCGMATGAASGVNQSGFSLLWKAGRLRFDGYDIAQHVAPIHAHRGLTAQRF
jgi:hypothetical protein